MGRGADDKLIPVGKHNPFRQEIRVPDRDIYRQVEIEGGYEWKNEMGQLHRNPAEGPARSITSLDDSGATVIREEYWQYGIKLDEMTAVKRLLSDGGEEWLDDLEQFHRDPKDGPARILANGTKEYYVHGKLHRDPREGPARTVHGGDGYEYNKITREWWENGQLLSRQSSETDSEPSTSTNYFDAQDNYHRDPAEGPARIFSEPYSSTEICCVHGVKGRDDGPAEIETYGDIVTEKYFNDNLLHRADGAAVISYNQEEGGREDISFAWRGREFLVKENGQEHWQHYRDNYDSFTAEEMVNKKG